MMATIVIRKKQLASNFFFCKLSIKITWQIVNHLIQFHDDFFSFFSNLYQHYQHDDDKHDDNDEHDNWNQHDNNQYDSS